MAVSSNGPASFSILYRIEPTVTGETSQQTASSTTFQYPLSDRTHCNLGATRAVPAAAPTFSILYRIEPTVTRVPGPAPPASRVFQYPLSDRTHCNTALLSCTGNKLLTFSILYRIEPTVTADSANYTVADGELSVSSIGSNPL